MNQLSLWGLVVQSFNNLLQLEGVARRDASHASQLEIAMPQKVNKVETEDTIDFYLSYGCVVDRP